MKPKILPSALASLILLAIASVVPAAAVPNFQVDHSDPASDVEQLWTSNMTAVTNPNGDPIASPFPDSINILWVRSRNATDPANVTISVEVQGNIVNQANTSYEFQLYTEPTTTSYFRVTYANGATVLDSTDPAFPAVDLTGNSTIDSVGPNPTIQNRLRINVEKDHLGTITSWNVRLLALERGLTYTYRDWGWEQAGNPGSSPTVLFGLVTEAGTGVPLEGANVSTDVGGYWTTTNASGGYTLSIASGTYNVTFARAGHLSWTVQVTIAAGETRQLDAELASLGLLGGALPWLLLAAIGLVAIAVVALFLLSRRRKREPPSSRP
jgi:hypothetical protein